MEGKQRLFGRDGGSICRCGEMDGGEGRAGAHYTDADLGEAGVDWLWGSDPESQFCGR